MGPVAFRCTTIDEQRQASLERIKLLYDKWLEAQDEKILKPLAEV
jgi:hypothetical protein